MTDLEAVERLRRNLGPPEDGHPVLKEIEAAVALGVEIGDPALAELMRRTVRDYVPVRLNVMLRYIEENPAMEVAGVNPRAWVAYKGRHCSLVLSLVHEASRNLHWHPYDALIQRMNEGSSEVRYYRLPHGAANEVVDLSARLESAGTRDFAKGDVLVKRAESDIVDLAGSADAPVVTAQLHLASKGGLDWTFDRQSLAPIGATENDPAESHLVSLIRAAALFDETDLRLLRRALLHPSHNVRWAALQAIGKLDADTAAALLPELGRDPHPHVRRAAERTLARLKA